jgi:hypothetical protein
VALVHEGLTDLLEGKLCLDLLYISVNKIGDECEALNGCREVANCAR